MLIVRIFVLFAFSILVFAEQNVINLNLHDLNFPSVQGKIHDIVKDRTGYYWLATSEGLKRYDGKEIQVFFGEKHEPLHNKLITALKLQGETLWVGSDAGLFSLDLKNFQLTLYPQFTGNSSIPRAGFISNIDVDHLGRVWITSPKGIDLYLQRSNQFKTFPIKTFKPNIRDSYVAASAVDDKGGVWLATYTHGAWFSLLTYLSPKTLVKLLKYQILKFYYTQKLMMRYLSKCMLTYLLGMTGKALCISRPLTEESSPWNVLQQK